MIKRAGQRATVVLARRWPAGLYGSLGCIARASARPAHRQATLQRIRTVFPELADAPARRVATELRGAELKTRALAVALAHTRSEPAYPPVAVDRAFAAVRGPAILATFHVGAIGALGAAIRRIPGEILALHRMDWRMPSNVAGAYVPHTDVGGAAVFYRSVMTIRRGGCVLLLVDGTAHEVSVLDRSLMLARGPFALARMTGAPVVPVFARWDGASIDVVCGATIAATDDELTMARAMAVALERHLLRHPAAIGEMLLRRLTEA
jgi:lauroyl/myristoyl acyltransferase